MSDERGRAVIVGSAFGERTPSGLKLDATTVSTAFGDVELHRVNGDETQWLLFRHGLPHRYLPNQIPYRAHAAALKEVGVEMLLVTSSVGVMDAALPLNTPMLVRDLLMLENRLPDGSACTIFTEVRPDHGHLVLTQGIFSDALDEEIRVICRDEDIELGPSAIFAYAQGPRTKTAIENRVLATLGAQVNSMTVGPEVVLANELEMATSAVVIGHKYSVPDRANPNTVGIEASLESARRAAEKLVVAFLERPMNIAFANEIYRFGEPE